MNPKPSALRAGLAGRGARSLAWAGALCVAGFGRSAGAEPPQEPAAPPAAGATQDRSARDIDADLRRSLEKQTAPEGSDASPVDRIGQRMRDVQGRLAQADGGDETRDLQAEIVRDLDKLIEAIKKGGG